MIHTLGILTASTSGHTDYVLDVVSADLLRTLPDLSVLRLRAESATRDDIAGVDAVIFGSGTWNTGGVEGQLNPYMDSLLFHTLAGVEFHKKPVAFVSLGDDRYYFTTRCTEHFLRFQRAAKMTALTSPLVIVNEPYGQEEKMRTWAQKVVAAIQASR